VLRFFILLACFYAITAMPWFRHSFMPAYLDWCARTSSCLLRLLGEETQVVGESIVSPRFGLSILRGCDGIDPAMLFIAAVLAFPGRWHARAGGIVFGVLFLLAANCLRIISLYYVGALKPEVFALVHIDIWQPLFVIITALTWIAWAKLASRSPRTLPLDADR